MIEPRVYRAAFLPALVALVVAMFSLGDRPPPLPQGLAADVLFEGTRSALLAERLIAAAPDRRPGTAGDLATADRVRRAFADRGLQVEADRFEADGRRLVNVVARRQGASTREIVVVAARDAGSVPDATASAADTAALLEMARVFEGRAARKTLVLASIDGSHAGQAGARRLADRLDRGRVEVVLVVSNLGAPRARGALLVPWSNDASRESIGLERTAADSLRQELGELPGQESAPGQLVRLAFPIGIGPQGVLLDRGFESIRFSGSGELPPAERDAAAIVPERYGDLGRALLRTVSAIDAAPPPRHGPASYLILARQVVPGWVLAVLGLTLMLPAAVAAVDAFARARRRGARPERWLRWVLLGAAPFAAAVLLALVLVLVGALPDAPGVAFPPADEPPGAGGAAALAGLAALVAAGWLAVRRLGPPRLGLPSRPDGAGAGTAAAVAVSLCVLVLWVLNPVAALLFAPAAHLWGAAAVLGLRRRVALWLVAAGLALPVGAAVFYLFRLGLDPLEGAWYGLLLVTGGHVDPTSSLLGCLLLGALGAVLAVVLARRPPLRPPEPVRPTVRGPVTYAGPGSLGGTESALRR